MTVSKNRALFIIMAVYIAVMTFATGIAITKPTPTDETAVLQRQVDQLTDLTLELLAENDAYMHEAFETADHMFVMRDTNDFLFRELDKVYARKAELESEIFFCNAHVSTDHYMLNLVEVELR